MIRRCCMFCVSMKTKPTGKCTNHLSIAFGQQINNTGKFKCKYFKEKTKGTF